MDKRTTLTIAFLTLCAATTVEVHAQDAAETAVIISGSSGQGRASRSLGSAISNSIGNAANSVRATTRSQPQVTTHRRSRSTRHRSNSYPVVIASDVDVLEYSDAPKYELENGATLRTSGAFYPSAKTACEKNCPDK